MDIVLSDITRKYSEIYSLFDLDNIQETFKKFSSMKGPV